MTEVRAYWPICEHCGRYMQRGALVSGNPEFSPVYEYDCDCESKRRVLSGRQSP